MSDKYRDISPAVSRKDKQFTRHETNKNTLRQFIVGRKIHREETDKTWRKLTFRRPIIYRDKSPCTTPKNAGFIH
jgi:hypothetical protein